VGTDGGVFSNDDLVDRRYRANNKVMPQTDIEYEREQMSNPKHHIHTDDEGEIYSRNKKYDRYNPSSKRSFQPGDMNIMD
jgi:hypothetical protein